MDAFSLFVQKNGEFVPADIWACGKCRIVARTEDLAERCCEPYVCKECGKETERQYWTMCDGCSDKQQEEKRLAREAKAERVTESPDDWWFDDSRNEYYEGVEAFLDEYADTPDSAPDVLFACHKHYFKLDAEDIIERTWEQADLSDYDYPLDSDSLQEALDKWMEEHAKGACWYTPDYSKGMDTADLIADIRKSIEEETKDIPTHQGE